MAAQFALESAIADVARSGSNAAMMSDSRSQLGALGALLQQVGAASAGALVAMRAEIAASVSGAQAAAQQSRAAAEATAAADAAGLAQALSAAAIASRAAVDNAMEGLRPLRSEIHLARRRSGNTASAKKSAEATSPPSKRSIHRKAISTRLAARSVRWPMPRRTAQVGRNSISAGAIWSPLPTICASKCAHQAARPRSLTIICAKICAASLNPKDCRIRRSTRNSPPIPTPLEAAKAYVSGDNDLRALQHVGQVSESIVADTAPPGEATGR